MKAIIPTELESYYDDWRMSPGLLSSGHVFFTGFTGVDQNGNLSDDPETQIRNVFEKIGFVLRDAGLNFGSIVEMTSYHIGLRENLRLFKSIRSEFVVEPYPAWTAIEVAGFVREGAIVEIRVIAAAPDYCS